MPSRSVRPPAGLRVAAALLGTLMLLLVGGPPASAAGQDQQVEGTRVFGTLQSSPDRAEQMAAAGVGLVTLEVYWDRFEPVEGQVQAAYVRQLRAELARYRSAGMEVVLAPGVHYPPGWLLQRPGSRYVNQHGAAHGSTEPGKDVPNMVFSQALRDKQGRYLKQLVAELGDDFYAIRLGGGWYGELNYPEPTYQGTTNSYWAFDDLASGKRPGRPPGIPANPVPDWRPGTPTTDHAAAAAFLDWYLDSLGDYHDWQIETVRELYPGRLLMLYPSWGLRPGQIEAAVAGDLSGTTSAERNGEVQRGFDFARFVGGISDPGVVVYTTWLNADASADSGDDPGYWSPVKYLSHLATDRPSPLRVMGENTGQDTRGDLDLSLAQARTYGLTGVVWAFEPELFDGRWATVADLEEAIGADRRLTSPLTLSGDTTPRPAVARRPWSTTMSVAGGTPPYVWRVSGLPRGVTSSPSRTGDLTLSGRPTSDGRHLVSITVTDRDGATASAVVDVLVKRPATNVRLLRAPSAGCWACGPPAAQPAATRGPSSR